MEKRINEIVNRLNKTKVINDTVDFQQERADRDAKESQKQVILTIFILIISNQMGGQLGDRPYFYFLCKGEGNREKKGFYILFSIKISFFYRTFFTFLKYYFMCELKVRLYSYV